MKCRIIVHNSAVNVAINTAEFGVHHLMCSFHLFQYHCNRICVTTDVALIQLCLQTINYSACLLWNCLLHNSNFRHHNNMGWSTFEKGVKAVFVHGNDTTAHFRNSPARAAAMKIGYPLSPFYSGESCINDHNDNRYRQREILRQNI